MNREDREKMNREDREKTRDASRREQERQPKEHKAGPPIEREHETREGIEEEDAKRKQERERR